MKLLIYYSLTGNLDYVATLLKDKGFELRKVIEKKRMPKSFFFRILIGGFRASVNAKGKLVDYNPDVSSYEEVVIGSPIWNGRFPPAINSVLKETNLTNKKVTFLLSSGSGEGEKAEKWIKEHMSNASIIFLKDPKKHSHELIKLDNL